MSDLDEIEGTILTPEAEWRTGTYEWQAEGDCLTCSEELVRLFGLKHTPRSLRDIRALVHPDDRCRIEADTRDVLHSDAKSYSRSFRIIRADGTIRAILDRGAIARDPAGKARAIRGINIDVTGEAGFESPPAAASMPILQGGSGAGLGGDHGVARLSETDILLEALFDGAPFGICLWDGDFRYLRVNSQFAALNGVAPDAHIGRRFDEILPHVERIDEVYRNWAQIIETGKPWRGVEVTVRTPARPGQPQRWEADFFPVQVEGRNVGIAGIVHEKGELSARARETDAQETDGQEIDAQETTEMRLRASELRYRTLFDALDEGFCVLEVRCDAPDGRTDYRVVEANPAFYKKTGFAEGILGRWMRELAPDLEEHWYEIYGRVAQTGQPVRFEENSDALGRWFDVYAFRLDGAQSQRVAVLFNDVSARKRHEQQTEMVMREVNHRSKNMLTLVEAVARQTASSHAADFLPRFGQRVRALAASQDLLFQHAWKAVPLADLIRSQLAHFSDLVGTRITFSGPALMVTADAAQALGMAFHELATNAAKYGALSNDTGCILIAWDVVRAGFAERLTLQWTEQDGPEVTAPAQRGFGSKVTTEMVEASTDGSVTVDYASSGLVWHLRCDASAVLCSG